MNWLVSKPEIFFPVIIVFLVICIGTGMVREKKRRKELEEIGKTLGLTYSYNPTVDIFTICSDFKIFQTNYWREVKNTLKGTINEVAYTFFDYSYHTQVTSGSGSPITLIVGLAEFKNITLPQLSLSAECFLHRWEEKLGRQKDIDFADYPEFSKNYLLKGEDPDKIKGLFKHKLIRFFETHDESISMEAIGNKLVLFVDRELTSTKKTQEFIKSTLEIINLLQDQKSILG